MKRPIPVYLVTSWLCLGMVFLLGSIGRIATRYQQAGEPIPPFILLLELAVLPLAVWLIWGFIRLRTLERWLCVFFFAYWAIFATWGMARLLLSADSARPSSIRVMVVLAVIWLAVFVPNLASIVYLFTGRFREFALWYVGERRREQMQRYAQKQVEKSLRG
jgi:hypothetical protein